MRAAMIDNGVVTNVILADVPGDLGAVACPNDVAPGWLYDGSAFTKPVQAVAVTSRDVNDERARRIAAGHTVTLSNGAVVAVQTRNEEDFRNLNGLVSQAIVHSIAQTPNAVLSFRDANNVEHDLSPALMIECGSLVGQAVELIYSKSWEIKALSPIPSDYKADSYWT